MASPQTTQRAWPLRAASVIALLVALVATAAATWGAHTVVRDQERRLLKERAGEVNLVLTSAIQAIPAGLGAQGGILKATRGSHAAYEQVAREAVAHGPGELTFAWLRPTQGGFVVLAAAGRGLQPGERISDVRARTMTQAMHNPLVLATPVVGADRKLGFALGPPSAPAGTVLYQETVLGPLRPPRAASSAPFAELEVAIYGTPTPRVAGILSSTTPHLPLRGDVLNLPLAAGGSHWLLSVKARRPLVGNVAADAWWVTLVVGLLGSVLIAVVIETVARRRDAALALYASEHQIAETLQRSLLPRLPQMTGLEFAARYLAGGRGQEVGGDWFDAFPVSGGRVGIAVGDVIGHDLAAASVMAQIRSALRAYAIDGDPPSTVVNRLDNLVETLGLTDLVTLIYAVLDPPAPDGSRLLTHTNAGHLAPLLRDPGGQVRPLTGGDSVVIGAPIAVDHTEVEQRLEPGSTLVLFTDGLVEVPGGSIEDATAELAATIGAAEPESGLEAMCDRILAQTAHRPLRDDVALLAIRIGHNVVLPADGRAAVTPELVEKSHAT